MHKEEGREKISGDRNSFDIKAMRECFQPNPLALSIPSENLEAWVNEEFIGRDGLVSANTRFTSFFWGGVLE